MQAIHSPCTIETFKASDGYVWRYRRYEPAGPRRGNVVCLHGIQSHGGWYGASCAYLARAGYRVDLLDRRGSGLNTEARGDARSFRRLLADIAEFLIAEHPDRPHLLGISWGSKLAITLEHFYPGLVRSIGLIAPGMCPRIGPGRGQRVTILAYRVFSPRRLFPIPLNDPALFTATPRWQAFIRDDPHALRQATARLLVESARLDIVLKRALRSIRVPLLLMLAGKDRIIDNPRTRAMIDRCPTADRRVIEYPEAHHTLEFEEDPTPIFADLLAWLDAHQEPVTTRP